MSTWPQAIAHLDADAFFASVEQALDPSLKGRPVVTGAERGVALAISYEAKNYGITRGMLMSDVRRRCPEAILLPSNFPAYNTFSERIFTILRRYSPSVEPASIDEAYIDLTGTRRLHRMGYADIAHDIQSTVERELGLSVSVGVSLSKTLAKVCSKYRKPHGVTAVAGDHLQLLLQRTPLERVCGFGHNTVALLGKYGLKTALDFIRKPASWAEQVLGKIGIEYWHELQGSPMYEVEEKTDLQKSISKTLTFTPPSSSQHLVYSHLLRNLEIACQKARKMNLGACRVVISLKTQQFSMQQAEITLRSPSASPLDLTQVVHTLFQQLFKAGTLYRATGVHLGDLRPLFPLQFGLFEEPAQSLNHLESLKAADAVQQKFGLESICLAGSLAARKALIEERKPWRLERRLSSQNKKKGFRLLTMLEPRGLRVRAS